MQAPGPPAAAAAAAAAGPPAASPHAASMQPSAGPHKQSALERAGLWSRISFAWVGPLIRKGWLDLKFQEDAARFLMPVCDDAPQLSQQFEQSYAHVKVCVVVPIPPQPGQSAHSWLPAPACCVVEQGQQRASDGRRPCTCGLAQCATAAAAAAAAA
jgi:hypothetical protein